MIPFKKNYPIQKLKLLETCNFIVYSLTIFFYAIKMIYLWFIYAANSNNLGRARSNLPIGAGTQVKKVCNTFISQSTDFALSPFLISF